MDNKKFEQLIELIINENEEQARALFHDIVVEKSREIYESMMDDEEDMEEGAGPMHGQVGDMLDEINADEEGMAEDDEEFDLEDEDGDEIVDIDTDEEEPEDLEDRVVDLEDKLDELMAEFEELMAGEEGGEEDFGGEEGGEEDFGGEEGGEEGPEEMMEASDDEEEDDEEEEEDELDESVMEAVELKQVPGLYGSKIGGDNGAQPKSPIGSAANAGQTGMASKPVKFSGDTESVPSSPKAPSNQYTKGEGQLKGAGSFKNAPGQKTQDLGKAPAPVKSQASGVNTKSPIAEGAKKAPAKAPAKKTK